MKKSLLLAVVIKALYLRCIFLIAVLFFANVNAAIVKILLMGDTQKIVDQQPDDFKETMDKVLTDDVTRDADFMLQMGDITEDSKASNWDVAQAGWYKLDGKMPYVLNIGNNDLAGDSNADQFNEHFPLSRYNTWPSFVDNHDRHNNVAHHFNAGGVDWLVISVRYNPTAAYMNWAEYLIRNNPDKKVIFVMHAANSDGSESKMCKKYDNVVLVLCGHTASRRELLTGNNGNKMGWVKTCWHHADLDSYLCVVELDTEAGTATFRYYSPFYGDYGDDPESALYKSDKCPTYENPWTWTGFDFGGVTNTQPQITSTPLNSIYGNDINIVLFNLKGQAVYKHNAKTPDNGIRELPEHGSGLRNGIYILKVQQGRRSLKLSLVK